MKYGTFRRGLGRAPMTRDWRVWLAYVGWWANHNLSQLPGATPRWAMSLLHRIPPRGFIIHHSAPRSTVHRKPGHPFSWWSCRLWVIWREWLTPAVHRVAGAMSAKRFRQFAHRCDWTDVETGLLYGGDGLAMNRAFEQFVENISPTPEDLARVDEAVDELASHLEQHGHEIN